MSTTSCNTSRTTIGELLQKAKKAIEYEKNSGMFWESNQYELEELIEDIRHFGHLDFRSLEKFGTPTWNNRYIEMYKDPKVGDDSLLNDRIHFTYPDGTDIMDHDIYNGHTLIVMPYGYDEFRPTPHHQRQKKIHRDDFFMRGQLFPSLAFQYESKDDYETMTCLILRNFNNSRFTIFGVKTESASEHEKPLEEK